MSIKQIALLARKIMPKFLFRWVRLVGSAVLTPFLFSYRTGHFKSALLGRAVDKCGRPIPWYTYPSVEFLETRNFKEKSVMEWGAGQSTFWWASRAKRVTAFESDLSWHTMIEKQKLPNVVIHKVPEDLQGAESLIVGKLFDMIIVDGLDRAKATNISIAHLSEDGAILVDNSEQYWSPREEYPILDMLQDKGFQRVDFFGNAPGVIQLHCTSLFFRSQCFLFLNLDPPKRYD